MSEVRIERFTLTERALHWVHAVAFFAMLLTGLALYLPALETAIGRRGLVKSTHLWSAIAWGAALVIVVLVGNRRALRRTAQELDNFDRDDLRFLTGRSGAPQGRFNGGQKVNAILTVAFALLFAVSGVLLWLGERDTRFRFDGTVFLHDALMWVSLVLLIGHLYLAVINPRTRHALAGITEGSVREDWAREHHAKWVDAPAVAPPEGVATPERSPV